MDFERVLEKCGNFGRYQFALLMLYGYTNILSSMHYFSQTLISFTPEHWCYHEKLANLTYDEIRAVYATVPDPHCTLLDDIVDGQPVVAEIGKCTNWIFDYEYGYESITTELKWVCHNAYQGAVGQSFLFVGSVTGTIFFGFLADKIGRLPALICTTLTGAAGDFMTAFVHTLPWFAISRLISGLSTDTLFMLMYIMVFEYLDPKKRTFGLNIITAFFYAFGLGLSPLYAVLVGTWRKYLLIVSLPALLVLIYPIFICESARWLLTKQRYDGAVKCLKRVAKANKRQVDDAVFEEFVQFYTQMTIEQEKLQKKKDDFWGMLRTPRLRKFTIILLIKSMVTTLSYDTISRNMEGLGTSPFLLFGLTSLAYAPSGIVIILLQNRIGRKGMAFSSLLIGGIITVLTGFIIAMVDGNSYAILLGLMVALGRFGAIVSYDSEAQYCAEMIPTSVRGQGVADIHVVGYACGFLSPYVIYLGNYYKPLPAILIGIIMLVGAMLCLGLPETLHKKLPDNLVEGEQFAIGEKWHYFPCFESKIRKRANEEYT